MVGRLLKLTEGTGPVSAKKSGFSVFIVNFLKCKIHSAGELVSSTSAMWP